MSVGGSRRIRRRDGKTQVTGLLRRVEASATTGLPVIAWIFLGPWLVYSVLPIERGLARIGVGTLPRWLLLGSVWSLSVVWVILDGSVTRYNRAFKMTTVVQGRISTSGARPMVCAYEEWSSDQMTART